MSSDLRQAKCQPCEGGVEAISLEAAHNLMPQIKTWQLSEEGKEIQRTFTFKDFHQTMAFVNALAWVAHREDHHPDLEVGYNRCLVRYSTHAIGGLSHNDFICAAKIDDLVAD
ncbi:MAG: 4a-hydroxytetrahydrobiopterin dehydratase [Gammaproteobacteria bacterium]|nr:4a-hydroxytetrahydrobiopterin dehydratase [Gammaproteobacteria bacterium]